MSTRVGGMSRQGHKTGCCSEEINKMDPSLLKGYTFHSPSQHLMTTISRLMTLLLRWGSGPVPNLPAVDSIGYYQVMWCGTVTSKEGTLPCPMVYHIKD